MAATAIILCKNGHQLRVPSELGALAVTCPRCKDTFEWPPPTHTSLSAIADLTGQLGSSPHTEAVRNLDSLLRDRNFRVVVFGEFSVGKSTLINALLGRAALPTKTIPTTGHVTNIRFGPTECVNVIFTNGQTESCSLDQLGSFVTLDLQSRAREGIESIDVILQSSLLKDDLTLIDAPGTCDTEIQTRRAERAVVGADMVLLVLRATQMLGSDIRQRAAVWMARELGKPVVPVLNGLNLIEEQDRRELRQLLAAWSNATLSPVFGKPFFEVNAIGALRYTLGVEGAEAPTDDFFALKTALDGIVGAFRRKIQTVSRSNQARAVLYSIAKWNSSKLKELTDAAGTLSRRRSEQRDRLRRTVDDIERRMVGEYAFVRARAVEKLGDGWTKLSGCLSTKTKYELETKRYQWFDTYLREAVRGVEQVVNERLASIALELDAPASEPLTLAQLASMESIGQLAAVPVSAPDNSAAMGTGGKLAVTALTIAARILAELVGVRFPPATGVPIIQNAWNDKANRKEPDVADYTTAARTDWNKWASTVEQAALDQFQARLNTLSDRLKQQMGDLERVPAPPDEIGLRCELDAMLQPMREQLSTACEPAS